jgi:hypothetical protein
VSVWKASQRRGLEAARGERVQGRHCGLPAASPHARPHSPAAAAPNAHLQRSISSIGNGGRQRLPCLGGKGQARLRFIAAGAEKKGGRGRAKQAGSYKKRCAGWPVAMK